MIQGKDKVVKSSFGVTFTSANQAEYPILFSGDLWHVVDKDGDLCYLYDNSNGTTTKGTGALFTLKEINDLLGMLLKKSIEDQLILSDNVDNLLKKTVAIYHYRGSVATYDDLAELTDVYVGDVYNVEETGMNYAYIDESKSRIRLYDGTVIMGTQLETLVYNSMLNPVVKEFNVNGLKKSYKIVGSNFGHTLRLYAFSLMLGGGSGATDTEDFLDLDSWDNINKCYTKTVSDVKYLILTPTTKWDALGSTVDTTLYWTD